MGKWLLFHYKIPPEPSAPRVYIWRKLKKIGAILVQDAVWILPNNPRTREQFQWLTVEITDLKGEATFWVADLGLGSQEEFLARLFSEQTDQAYTEILESLDGPDPNLGELSQQYQLIRARDYFHSEMGGRVRERLVVARENEP